MKRLFLLDFFRGEHSTGLAAIRGLDTVKIAKMASHPLDLFDHPKFKEALNGMASRVFIGHNRAATRGAVSNYNAHPYHFGKIVGAHNGTLDAASVKRLEEAIGEQFPVDSMAIFAGFDALGVEETISLMEEGADWQTGAWSLVWYNTEKGTLNFLRNKHRPMWYSYSDTFDKIVWASEWPMIDAAARLSSTEYKLYADNKGFKFFPTDENVWYEYLVSDLKATGAVKPKPKAKFVKGREPVKVAKRDDYDPFGRGSGTSYSTIRHTPTSKDKTTSRGPTQTARTMVNLLGSAADPMAGYLTKEAFDEIAKYGCTWCATDVEFEEPGLTIWERDGVVLCPSCSRSDDNNIPATKIYATSIENL